MAIYKPTDCSPFNGTFDATADKPIIFECKVDTSNTKVTGYTIEIYDSDTNQKVFPGSSSSAATELKNRITYLPDLKTYVSNKFPSVVLGIGNANTGLNGTYIEIPFYVEQVDKTNDSTVGRNQMSSDLENGKTYLWKITLYQEITKNGNSVTLPTELKYYDMTVANGVVLGSNEKRIHTALVDSVPNVVDNLVLLDKFIQPVNISTHFKFDPEDPINWAGTAISQTATRCLITGYDSTYGYVYPSTSSTNSFTSGQIAPDTANGFRIYKMGNNPANLTAADMVDYIYEKDPTIKPDGWDGEWKWEWKHSNVNEEQSYYEETYEIKGASAPQAYTPLPGGPSLVGNERLILNGFGKTKSSSYFGDAYNGIFRPDFSYKSKKNDKDEVTGYVITVRWFRVTDAASWGTLSKKVVYCRADGKNYEVNTRTVAGETNKTPVLFAEEQPIRLFNTTKVQELAGLTLDKNSGIGTIPSDKPDISELLSATSSDDKDILSKCIYEFQGRTIRYNKTDENDKVPAKITISYVPYAEQDYTGVIFYNNPNDTTKKIVYIRPSSNIRNQMKMQTSKGSVTIESFNSVYNYITYSETAPNFEIDKTQYQIKSFYKESDYNPFSLYGNPTIKSYLTVNGVKSIDPMSTDEDNTVGARNFSVTATYEQNNYISWKSYQWTLYDSTKNTVLEKTNEIYDGEITGTFYGMENKTNYILSLVLQINNGKIIHEDYLLNVEFQETKPPEDYTVNAIFECDTLSTKVDLSTPSDVVVAPRADYYSLPPETAESKSYYNYMADKGVFYQIINKGKAIEDIAMINSDPGEIIILRDNVLSFENVFSSYELEQASRGVWISDSDNITIEGQFSFSKNYNGNIIGLSNGTGGFSINIPVPIIDDADTGFIKISDDINKIEIRKGVYLKIVDGGGDKKDFWQDSNEFFNVSEWSRYQWSDGGSVKVEELGTVGNRTNVANFKYATTVKQDDEGNPVKDNEGHTVYERNTFINIDGPFNTANEDKPVTDILTVSVSENGGVEFNPQGKSGISTIKRGEEGKENPERETLLVCQPSRMIWVEHVPESKIKKVVVDATSNSTSTTITTTKMSVLTQTVKTWEEKDNKGHSDGYIWYDGSYINNGSKISASLGKIIVNGAEIPDDDKNPVAFPKRHITRTDDPIYSGSGLICHSIAPVSKLSERENISNYDFRLRLVVNPNTMIVDRFNSYGYVSPIQNGEGENV